MPTFLFCSSSLQAKHFQIHNDMYRQYIFLLLHVLTSTMYNTYAKSNAKQNKLIDTNCLNNVHCTVLERCDIREFIL